MSRKINKGHRCDTCRMKDTHCICPHLVTHENKTPVTVLMHYRELVTTTNTARIAHLMLKNSSIHCRGLIETRIVDSQGLQDGYTPLYLYPSEESIPLTQELVQKLGGKIQLIVPDGSWRQAKRVSKREPFLKNVQHVKLNDVSAGIFYLRKKIKAEGVSTMEAIARALGVIESKEIQQSMENVFRIMVEKTLDTRGKKIENYEPPRST